MIRSTESCPPDAPAEGELWSYRSEGLCTVGQDEVVILLVRNQDENLPHRDMFEHFQSLYEQAKSGEDRDSIATWKRT